MENKESNWYDQYKVDENNTVSNSSSNAPEANWYDQYKVSDKSPEKNESSSNGLWNFTGNLAKTALQVDPLMQIGRDIVNVGKQIPKAAVEGYGKIPQAIDSIKKNVPEAFNQLKNNPKRFGKNALAGTGELLNRYANMPPEIAKYLGHIGAIGKDVAEYMPKPFSEDEAKQWGNNFVGEKQPGDEAIRGAVRNADLMYGGTKAAFALNPTNLSRNSIIRKVLNAKEKNYSKYTGENGLYTNLFKEADKRGINKVDYNPSNIDFKSIEHGVPEKVYESINNFKSDPSLRNAQSALSDIKYQERNMKHKTLTDSERKAKASLLVAKKEIESNMFKDTTGKIHFDLYNKFKNINKGYAKEVIPYTRNKTIQKYLDDELNKKNFVKKLSTGKYGPKMERYHPELIRRDNMINLLKAGGALTGIGGTFAGGSAILDALLNKR
jgi:hypothetical protein